MENIRIFVGIACPPDVCRAVSALSDKMSDALSFRKWTHPDDLHVTLHFLGETPADRLDAISRVLEEAAAQAAPFSLSITEPGIFGQPGAPRILWLGLKEDGAKQLKQLHQSLRPGLVNAGCQLDEKPFRAHLTLARQGGAGSSPETNQAAWKSAVRDQPPASALLQWRADGITLFRSHLGRRPSYEKMRIFPFGMPENQQS